MQVGGRGSHGAAYARVAFFICGGVSVMMRDIAGIGIREIVLQMQDEKIAGLQPQVGRLVAVSIDITVARRAIGGGNVMDGKLHFEDAILAA
jgi:hypothetical protein